MKGRVIALGFFDGVHAGHGVLLRETARIAALEGLDPAALTFRGQVAGKPSRQLTTPEERERLIRELYRLKTIFLTFDDTLRDMLPVDFVRLLRERFEAVHLVAGYDFTFGRRGAGNAETLRSCCAELGLFCTVIESVFLDGAPVSTSRIREMLAAGRLAKAVELLGHPYELTLELYEADGAYWSHGVPDDVFLPAPGTYLGRTQWGQVTIELGGRCMRVAGLGAMSGTVRLLMEREI